MPTVLRILLLTLLLFGCDKNVSTSRETQTEGSPSTTSVTTDGNGSGNTKSNGYVGSGQCVSCHQKEFQSWRKSHHDLAMQKASNEAVLGNFNNAEFNYFGTVSRFFKQNGKYFVRTDGPDGELHDYRIAYTFGTYPLQQYLVEFSGGKLQALSIAWDSRGKSEGGQRWYHLNPDEHIQHGDELHWTDLNYNWNFMCADCHSTNLQKNYDLRSESYDTSWTDINVGCEACHGPGSSHLQWAVSPVDKIAHKGLAVSYAGRKQAAWTMDAETGIAHLQQPANTQAEIETCAQCHSRRATSFPGAQAGDQLLDNFNPALLREPLYHADGQINDEVYVYGSFLQSKMYTAGVTCSNCHEPHSLQLRAKGNDVCAQCHLPARFDTPEHHFHPLYSSGAQCVNCHMLAKTYMQVDVRRDHSFRIPRPDLSDELETPNTCTGCHRDRSNKWAAKILQGKFGKPVQGHYGKALYAGRHGLPGAKSQLMQLITDESQPDIARATAVSLLPRYLAMESAQLLQAIARGDAPLLNLGLAQQLEILPPQILPALAIPLLYDDGRVTASLAASALAGVPGDSFPPAVQQQLTRALNNYLESEKFNADRPESLTNLAGLHAQRGNRKQAEAFYQRALAIAPYYSPAYINLAELYRSAGREKEVEVLLRDALHKASDRAVVKHALGLSLARQQRKPEALEYLRQAAESPAATGRYIYVYAIALNSSGNPQQAISVLERGRQLLPRDREILRALVSLNRETGHLAQAQHYQQLLE